MHLIHIVLPVFVVIGLGYALRRRGFIEADTHALLSRLVFYVAAPCLLFRSMAQGSFAWSTRLPAVLVVGAITVAVGLVVYAASSRMAPSRRGVLAQGCHRSNTVFFGLPMVLYAFGDGALGPASIVIAFMVIVENLLSVIVLTLPHQTRSARDPAMWADTGLRIARNPLILGCLGGIVWAQIGLTIPLGIDRSLALIGSIAAPLGLLCVGAGLEFGRLRFDLGPTALAALVRLVLHPALIYVALRAMGLAGIELGTPVLIMACPTAVVTYIMARELGGDARFAGAIVLGTTAASMVTLVGWLALLGIG